MATARHVARVHAGGGGAPPAATERHGGGGSVTPARTAARPPGTARPGRGGGRPSPRVGQTERGRWGGSPSGPRGRRWGGLRRAPSAARAAPGDARQSGLRESGGRRALPASGGTARGRLGPRARGWGPLEAGPGKPLGRPRSCPRPPRPAPAGRPHPAGGAGRARAAPPRRCAGGRRRRRSAEGARPGGTGRQSRGGRCRQCGPSAAGSAATRRRQDRAGTGRGARRGGGPGWAPSRGAAAPSQPAGGAGQGGAGPLCGTAPLCGAALEGARGGERGKIRVEHRVPGAARSGSGPRGAAWGRRGGACRPEAIPRSGLAAVRLYRCRHGAGRPGRAEGARLGAAYLLRECGRSSRSPLCAFPFSCLLPLVWVFFLSALAWLWAPREIVVG